MRARLPAQPTTPIKSATSASSAKVRPLAVAPAQARGVQPPWRVQAKRPVSEAGDPPELEASTEPGTPPFYLLEGHLTGTLDEAEARLRYLCTLCQDSAVAASIDYVQMDEEGEWLSEEFTLATG